MRDFLTGFQIKYVAIGALAFLALLVGSCTFGYRVIEPGHTGIKINRLGTDRGVSKDNIISGFVPFFKPTTRIVEYPTFMQRVAWTHDVKEGHTANEELTFNTQDSVPVNIDVAVSYTLEPSKVPEFYTKFRCDDISMFTHGFLRDTTRNVVAQLGSEYKFDEINGAKKEEFLAKVAIALNDHVKPYGVNIQQFGLIGSLRPPQALLDAVNSKTQAIQKSMQVENEVREAEAQAKKKIAIANGEAAANRALASSLDPKLLEWERLKIQRVQVERWNGKLPDTMLGGNNPLIYNLK